jgi:EREBP-like factor
MTHMMSRELEQMIGGRKAKYKGVRWRPERKHPWIAELKLPQKKKIWIGSFDTPEEAARAHDVAAIHHGK